MMTMLEKLAALEEKESYRNSDALAHPPKQDGRKFDERSLHAMLLVNEHEREIADERRRARIGGTMLALGGAGIAGSSSTLYPRSRPSLLGVNTAEQLAELMRNHKSDRRMAIAGMGAGALIAGQGIADVLMNKEVVHPLERSPYSLYPYSR